MEIAGRTIEELYGPAMNITDQAEADSYFESLVTRYVRCFPSASREDAERVERANLGYYAGYYSHDTRARVERLFKCVHPVLGAIGSNGPPTTEQALNAGLALGLGFSVKNGVIVGLPDRKS